jgi:hypothetical protein
MEQANEENSKYTPIVDFLKESLPQRNSCPYLAVFALTHADKDHCQGFGTLLDSDILIGELWIIPRLWHEHAEDETELYGVARQFHKEADRRRPVLPVRHHVLIVGRREGGKHIELLVQPAGADEAWLKRMLRSQPVIVFLVFTMMICRVFVKSAGQSALLKNSSV